MPCLPANDPTTRPGCPASHLRTRLCRPGRRPKTRFAVLMIVIAAMGLSVLVNGVPDPETLTTRIRAIGPFAPVATVAATAIMVSALIPRTLLAVAAGLLLGPVTGAVCVVAGAAIGASLCFAAGRWLGRDFVLIRGRAAGNARAAAIDRGIVAADRWSSSRGVLSALTLRLLPIAPFGLVSYAFGVSGARFGHFLLGTALGIVPSTAIYATLGAHVLSPGTLGFFLSLAAAAALLAAGLAGANALTGARR